MIDIQSYNSSVSEANIKVPNGWKLFKWKDLITSYDQGLIRSNRELSDSGIFYLKMNNITTDGFSNCSKMEYTHVNNDELCKYSLKNGDFLINIRNSFDLVGKTCVVSGLKTDAVYNHMLVKIEHVDRRLNYYINALFSKTDWKKYIDGCRKGTTTVIALYKEDLEEIIIPIPPEKEFDEIVKIERTIRADIDNNNEICAIIKAMIKEVYNYWFVQFDFPDHNGKPYKSSGGKMVWNEKLKREIPDGWEAKALYNIAEYSSDKITARELSSHTYIGVDNLIPNMQGRTESDYTPNEGFATAFQPQDILLGNIRPYFKKIWFSDLEGGASPDVLVIRAKNGKESGFVYSLLARDAFFDYDTKGTKGSKMPRGDKEHIMNYPFAYSNSVAISFSNQISVLIKKVAAIYYENQQLVELRGFLLPMLINGQATIAD